MQGIFCTLTVYFDAPYWVGVVERHMDGRLEACKITFGAEPKDYDVYAYILAQWHALRYSPAQDADKPKALASMSPKRRQRGIGKALKKSGAGTKAQQALKAQHAAAKVARKAQRTLQKETENDQRYRLKQQKKKEKRKGH